MEEGGCWSDKKIHDGLWHWQDVITHTNESAFMKLYCIDQEG